MHRERRRIVKVINHPNYDSSTTNNDIALVKLDKKVEYTKYIRPACLVESGEVTQSGKEVVISGWGTTQSGGSQPNKLQEAEVFNAFNRLNTPILLKTFVMILGILPNYSLSYQKTCNL